MPAWIWFVVALVAAAGGALLLWYDRARPTRRRGNARRDWAASKGWEFTDALSSPPHAWRYGTLRGEGPRAAYDVATGAVPGPGGRRLGCIFDQEQDGVTVATVAAVRGTIAVPVAIELRLPESPRPDDDELDNLGQVGHRYAFVSNALEGRRLLTRQVTDAADRVGADVPLVWAEDTWVLASIEPDADPDRVEGLVESLVDVSAAIKEAVEGGGSHGPAAAGSPADEAPTAVVAGRARGGPAGDEAPTTAVRGSRTDDAATATVPGSRGDDAATTAVPRSGAPAAGGRERDEDEDLEYDEELERFAAGDEDASPFSRGGTEPTHRERPADIPYDLEQDDPGSGEQSEGPRSTHGATWRSGPFRGR